ncbi:MAG TPA: penicillin acylase family protein [Candidatus Methylomirabilis sp.]|nr:penicillin acylase family protein [Candidatus Methylomirabilis sp.]
MKRMIVAMALVFSCAIECPPQARAQTPTLEARARAAIAVIRGTLNVHGLQSAVRVQRDRWGVAHIFAQNEHDLFFAQGFVVAQDRLFQMELWKRSGQGRLAEILGASAVQRDINARLLRYRGDMEAEYKSYAPDTKEILEAFTAGINAYIEEIQKPGGIGLPLEFQIAGFKPEPWKPEDCLNRMAAYSMTMNAGSELQHAQMVAMLGADKASSLFEFDPPVKLDPAPGIDFAGLSPAILENLVGSDVRMDFHGARLEGSNNWTVSGALTASGKPLLANDPHRVIAEPSLRYIVHLVAPGWDVIGAGESGLPGVAVGHNEKIAWGFTIFGLDQQDLYLSELNPADPEQYKTEHGWQRMEVKTETIGVRGGDPVTVKLKFTRHGPVLWEDGKRALALRWVGADPGTAGYLGSLALDRAESWTEFEDAMARWKVPSENIVYADRDGNIGEHSTGLAPLRKNWTGLLPVPENGGYDWTGFVPNSELPHTYNPASGFIATANHKMIPENYRYSVGFSWGSPERFLRISQVLGDAAKNARKLRVADMENLQNDVVSLPARELQALLKHAAGSTSDSVTKLLLDWDCALSTDSSAATLYEFWVGELRDAVTKLVVPPEAQKAAGRISLPRTVRELSHPRAHEFGPQPEGARDALLLESLKSAERKLTAKLGSDPGNWAWGKLHRVVFNHSLDVSDAAAALFDRGPYARPGDGYTVNATAFAASSFLQLAGASYREIFDLSDWDNGVGVNVPGQSGQPGSSHYDDLLPLWTNGQYFPLRFTKPAVDRDTTDVLELKP